MSHYRAGLPPTGFGLAIDPACSMCLDQGLRCWINQLKRFHEPWVNAVFLDPALPRIDEIRWPSKRNNSFETIYILIISTLFFPNIYSKTSTSKMVIGELCCSLLGIAIFGCSIHGIEQHPIILFLPYLYSKLICVPYFPIYGKWYLLLYFVFLLASQIGE